jgi:hypothetical protein
MHKQSGSLVLWTSSGLDGLDHAELAAQSAFGAGYSALAKRLTFSVYFFTFFSFPLFESQSRVTRRVTCLVTDPTTNHQLNKRLLETRNLPLSLTPAVEAKAKAVTSTVSGAEDSSALDY